MILGSVSANGRMNKKKSAKSAPPRETNVSARWSLLGESVS